MTYTFNFLFWVLDAIKNFSSKRSKLNNIIFSREVKCMIMLLFKIIWFETSTAAAKMYLLGTTPKLTLHYITIHAMFAQVLIRPGVLLMPIKNCQEKQTPCTQSSCATIDDIFRPLAFMLLS